MADITPSKPLNSKSKEIVFNVSEHFRKEGKDFLYRTADATGVGRTTVVKVRQEKKESGHLRSPSRQNRGEYKAIDDFDQCVIRNKVQEFYTIRKQLPTLKALHAVLKDEIGYPCGKTTLLATMNKLGFRWKKTWDNRHVLIERPGVVSQHLAFYQKRKEFEERGLEFIYIDETWVDTSCTSKSCWQTSTNPGFYKPYNRGQRIIVVHAGGKDGFVPGALLVYKARSTTGDYHSEMDSVNFTKWVTEMLIPNLDQPCAIVMDNASYHSVKSDRLPTSNSRKADIQEWLRSHGVAFEPTLLRPQLLELARQNRPTPVYAIDDVIRSNGHEVLRLPPYYPEFNAIELIWGQVKDYVRQNNVTFRFDDVLLHTREAFASIGHEQWSKACQHVNTLVARSMQNDHIVDGILDTLVINLADDIDSGTSSSEDND